MSTQKPGPVRLVVTIAAAAALIGFAAIYFMGGLADNGLAPENARAPATSQPARASRTAGDGSADRPSAQVASRRLNSGHMATFVFKDAPHPLPKLTFNGPDGRALTLEDWKGKVVLLNLWATWCGPCRKEMPHLDKLQARLGGDEFEVVAVSIDRGSDEKPKKFLSEIGVRSLALYHDPSAQLGFTLMAIGMPATLLIDAEGREIGRLVGPAEWDSEDAIRLIKAHFKSAAPD